MSQTINPLLATNIDIQDANGNSVPISNLCEVLGSTDLIEVDISQGSVTIGIPTEFKPTKITASDDISGANLKSSGNVTANGNVSAATVQATTSMKIGDYTLLVGQRTSAFKK